MNRRLRSGRPAGPPYGMRPVANYFVGRGLDEQIPVDPMRAQKIVFIAHGRHLCDMRAPLVSEPALAWKWGPVFPALYHDLRLFGNKPIKHPIYSSAGDDFWIPTVAPDDECTVDLLQRVWIAFGSMSARQLSDTMHLPGSPWFETRRRAGIAVGEPSDIEIDLALIAKHFEGNFKC